MYSFFYIHPSNHTSCCQSSLAYCHINIANRHISIVTCLLSHGMKVRQHIISVTSLPLHRHRHTGIVFCHIFSVNHHIEMVDRHMVSVYRHIVHVTYLLSHGATNRPSYKC